MHTANRFRQLFYSFQIHPRVTGGQTTGRGLPFAGNSAAGSSRINGSAENKKQFLIPKGFAHGFLVLSDEAEFCYKCDDFYHPNDEGGLAWNDPEIGVEWPDVKGEYKGNASAEGYTL